MEFRVKEPPVNIGDKISRQSFEIIKKEVASYARYHTFSSDEQAVIERLIHTTTCFKEVIEHIYFTKEALPRLKNLLQDGARIIVDTNMIRSGLSDFYLRTYGNEVICYINEDEVFAMAKREKTTRSYAAVKLAIERFGDAPMILACGNAPTFIYAAINTLIKRAINPSQVVLLLFPVGFVNVVESKEYAKEYLEHFGAEGIILKGRFGASTMAVATLHAAYRLIYDYDTLEGKYNGK